MLLVVHAAAYLALLVTALTWQQAVVFAAVHQAVFGIYLGCSFAPNHKGMPVLEPDQAADPLLRQVLTSRNVRGGPFVDYARGGLNYQIEHHLFPSMPRPNRGTRRSWSADSARTGPSITRRPPPARPTPPRSATYTRWAQTSAPQGDGAEDQSSRQAPGSVPPRRDIRTVRFASGNRGWPAPRRCAVHQRT
jgi:hypothetical protein